PRPEADLVDRCRLVGPQPAHQDLGGQAAQFVLRWGDGRQRDLGDIGTLVVVGDQCQGLRDAQAGAPCGPFEPGALAVAEYQCGTRPGVLQMSPGPVGTGLAPAAIPGQTAILGSRPAL